MKGQEYMLVITLYTFLIATFASLWAASLLPDLGGRRYVLAFVVSAGGAAIAAISALTIIAYARDFLKTD